MMTTVEEGSALSEAKQAEVFQGERPTLRNFAKGILDGRFNKLVVVVGAGMSCAAGLPDFRSPKTGLYSRLKMLDLPTPQVVVITVAAAAAAATGCMLVCVRVRDRVQSHLAPMLPCRVSLTFPSFARTQSHSTCLPRNSILGGSSPHEPTFSLHCCTKRCASATRTCPGVHALKQHVSRFLLAGAAPTGVHTKH